MIAELTVAAWLGLTLIGTVVGCGLAFLMGYLVFRHKHRWEPDGKSGLRCVTCFERRTVHVDRDSPGFWTERV